MNECPSNDEDFLASVLQAFAKIPVSTKNTIDDNGLFQEIFPLQSSTNSEIAALATQVSMISFGRIYYTEHTTSYTKHGPVCIKYIESLKPSVWLELA